MLKAITQVEGLEWVRMLYVYPENIDEEFLEFWSKEPKLLPYIDIPMQHGDDAVLARMNRDVTQAELLKTIKAVRAKVQGVAIRTSVMVGFPGETEEEFDALLGFIKEAKFDHLGCFTYSKEEGTVAGRMEEQVSPEVANERLAKVMELQKSISSGRLQSYIGETIPVLVKGVSEESELLWEGRMAQQAPEVDGVVYINDGEPKQGSIQYVKITDAFEYDLVGHIVEPH
jgi:ribosomal protein S12 methylthiotransferase